MRDLLEHDAGKLAAGLMFANNRQVHPKAVVVR
jgi:hypothetical protein